MTNSSVLLYTLIAIAGLAIYFAPTIVACYKDHKYASLLFLVNLLSGWTVLGWIACLVWAQNDDIKERVARSNLIEIAPDNDDTKLIRDARAKLEKLKLLVAQKELTELQARLGVTYRDR
jgi:hypothetical protein